MSSHLAVGIVGAGAIGMGYAAYLTERGHKASVWSPSGKRTAFLSRGVPLKVTGAVHGEFSPRVLRSPQDLVANDVIVFALPAYGWQNVFDQVLPLLDSRHSVILSGHLSFAALYISMKLSERGLQIPIVVWNTTALTAKAPNAYDHVRIGRLRAKVDVVVVPSTLTSRGMDLCETLFGDRFSDTGDLLTNALSNLNPLAHLGIALCNLTRMETGENWLQNTYTTKHVCNLLEALDKERLAIAAAFGKSIPSMKQRMETSLNASELTLLELTELEIEHGIDPPGPKTTETRYVLEDVPFGLVPTLMLADLVEIPAPVHRSGVVLLNACYGRDFEQENFLLPMLGTMTKDRFSSLAIKSI